MKIYAITSPTNSATYLRSNAKRLNTSPEVSTPTVNVPGCPLFKGKGSAGGGLLGGLTGLCVAGLFPVGGLALLVGTAIGTVAGAIGGNELEKGYNKLVEPEEDEEFPTNTGTGRGEE